MKLLISSTFSYKLYHKNVNNSICLEMFIILWCNKNVISSTWWRDFPRDQIVAPYARTAPTRFSVGTVTVLWPSIIYAVCFYHFGQEKIAGKIFQKLLTNQKNGAIIHSKFEYHKKRLWWRRSDSDARQRVVGWCETTAELSSDLSLLSRRTERRMLSRLLP